MIPTHVKQKHSPRIEAHLASLYDFAFFQVTVDFTAVIAEALQQGQPSDYAPWLAPTASYYRLIGALMAAAQEAFEPSPRGLHLAFEVHYDSDLHFIVKTQTFNTDATVLSQLRATAEALVPVFHHLILQARAELSITLKLIVNEEDPSSWPTRGAEEKVV